ncbi:MAG TPA: alpha/beta hydrolase, partial [Microlunatus sp.]|nr:alpha/beta hydrolase [Microlunatus sp.]
MVAGAADEFFEISVFPVLDIQEIAQIGGEAVASGGVQGNRGLVTSIWIAADHCLCQPVPTGGQNEPAGMQLARRSIDVRRGESRLVGGATRRGTDAAEESSRSADVGLLWLKACRRRRADDCRESGVGMTDCFEVATADGGSVTVWVEGRGPALVLVHGSLSDHSPLQPFIDELSGDITCYALDRRGFGASPDALDYSAEREFSDVATVVAAVADRTGERVALFGHSWGASCALGAAPGLTALRTLILYEPSLGLRYPPGAIDQMAALLAAGDADGAVVI